GSGRRIWRAFRRWIWRVSGWADVACRNTVHELPVGLTSLYIRIPKTPRTEHGKNDLHYCQRTTASGDCRSRPAGAERRSFGNTIKLPFPATVVIVPAGVTFRIRWLAESTMKRFITL